MAGDWLKWTKGLAWKDEVLGVARRLGIHRQQAAAACMEIWEWLDSVSADASSIKSATLADVDAKSGVPGLGKALLAEGWLLVDDFGLHFPNADRHNSETAKRRAMANDRQRRRRARVTQK